ncbi:tetratricopeptide repeat protein, partial [Paenibacillus sp. MCAF20]
RAVRSLDRFHYDKALKYFRRAVEYEPDNPVNHCNMAGILSEMGNYEESNRILNMIMDELDPTMTECYFYMANNYANMEQYEAAEGALIQYLEEDPDGQFLDEAEDMMDLLHYELERPTQLKNIKSREGMIE